MLAFDVSCGPPGQLAFVRNEQIFLVRTNNTGLLQLTSSGHNKDPAWSPDGTRIAFASDRGGRWDIYVMNADGSNVVALTNTGLNDEPIWGYNVEPSWSPDGQRIAFKTNRSDSAGVEVVGIYVVSLASAIATPLVTGLGNPHQPAWSPGGEIAFVSGSSATDVAFNVFVTHADGSSVRELFVGLAPYPITAYFQPEWSRDGSRIAVNVCAYDEWQDCVLPVSTVMVANTDGSGLTALAPGGGDSNPTWSPDGRTLAFASTPCYPCATSLHYVRVDGTQEGAILLDGHSPSWRPSP
jgi:Tol biopolymer transport system component